MSDAVPTSSRSKSNGEATTVLPVRFETNMVVTEGHLATAVTTVFLSSISLPPRTPWSAVITTFASAAIKIIKIYNQL